MDFQFHNGVNGQPGSIEAGYNNYNAAGGREDFYVSRGNEGVQQLQQIPVGKAFRGEVTDVVNNRVHIRLENGQQVQARLTEPMNLNIGDKLLFQVKSNAEGLIEIKPIMNSLLGQEATILRALEAAKLPVGEKTVQMMQSLLKEQMPIDKNSLQQMYKQILGNGGAHIDTIVQMNKLHIPVTQANIGQFEAYQNYEHRIAAQTEQFAQQLGELLEQMPKDSEATGRFHMQLLQILGTETEQVFEKQPFAEQEPANGQAAAGEQPELLLPKGTEEKTPVQEALAGRAGETAPDGLPAAKEGQPPEQAVLQRGQAGFELSVPERESLLAKLDQLPVSEEVKQQIRTGEAPVQTVLKEIQNAMADPFFKASGILQDKSYHKLLKAQIKEQWFVKPEQLAQGERMEHFYEKLRHQGGQLEQMIADAGKGDSAAAKTLSGIKENIDFMNQINQMFTYAQIPLMMSGKTAHSDLYVFTKKKNLREHEGKLSALLHLDMDALGSLDVYVELDGTKVSTQFKVAQEELVELFQEHMGFLQARIEEKGYRFSSAVEPAARDVDFVEDFLKRDHGSAPMQRFAFDVRA